MMRTVIIVFVMGFAWPGFSAAQTPFKLPLSAKITATSLEKGGWKTNGKIGVSFEQAKKQLAVKLSSGGWVHMHSIALGKDRDVEAWTRGNEELTLMTWRISAGKAGFAYGVTQKADNDGSNVKSKRGGRTNGR